MERVFVRGTTTSAFKAQNPETQNNPLMKTEAGGTYDARLKTVSNSLRDSEVGATLQNSNSNQSTLQQWLDEGFEDIVQEITKDVLLERAIEEQQPNVNKQIQTVVLPQLAGILKTSEHIKDYKVLQTYIQDELIPHATTIQQQADYLYLSRLFNATKDAKNNKDLLDKTYPIDPELPRDARKSIQAQKDKLQAQLQAWPTEDDKKFNQKLLSLCRKNGSVIEPNFEGIIQQLPDLIQQAHRYHQQLEAEKNNPDIQREKKYQDLQGKHAEDYGLGDNVSNSRSLIELIENKLSFNIVTNLASFTNYIDQAILELPSNGQTLEVAIPNPQEKSLLTTKLNIAVALYSALVEKSTGSNTSSPLQGYAQSKKESVKSILKALGKKTEEEQNKPITSYQASLNSCIKEVPVKEIQATLRNFGPLISSQLKSTASFKTEIDQLIQSKWTQKEDALEVTKIALLNDGKAGLDPIQVLTHGLKSLRNPGAKEYIILRKLFLQHQNAKDSIYYAVVKTLLEIENKPDFRKILETTSTELKRSAFTQQMQDSYAEFLEDIATSYEPPAQAQSKAGATPEITIDGMPVSKMTHTDTSTHLETLRKDLEANTQTLQKLQQKQQSNKDLSQKLQQKTVALEQAQKQYQALNPGGSPTTGPPPPPPPPPPPSKAGVIPSGSPKSAPLPRPPSTPGALGPRLPAAAPSAANPTTPSSSPQTVSQPMQAYQNMKNLEAEVKQLEKSLQEQPRTQQLIEYRTQDDTSLKVEIQALEERIKELHKLSVSSPQLTPEAAQSYEAQQLRQQLQQQQATQQGALTAERSQFSAVTQRLSADKAAAEAERDTLAAAKKALEAEHAALRKSTRDQLLATTTLGEGTYTQLEACIAACVDSKGSFSASSFNAEEFAQILCKELRVVEVLHTTLLDPQGKPLSPDDITDAITTQITTNFAQQSRNSADMKKHLAQVAQVMQSYKSEKFLSGIKWATIIAAVLTCTAITIACVPLGAPGLISAAVVSAAIGLVGVGIVSNTHAGKERIKKSRVSELAPRLKVACTKMIDQVKDQALGQVVDKAMIDMKNHSRIPSNTLTTEIDEVKKGFTRILEQTISQTLKPSESHVLREVASGATPAAAQRTWTERVQAPGREQDGESQQPPARSSAGREVQRRTRTTPDDRGQK